jgi:hypothetical protein
VLSVIGGSLVLGIAMVLVEDFAFSRKIGSNYRLSATWIIAFFLMLGASAYTTSLRQTLIFDYYKFDISSDETLNQIANQFYRLNVFKSEQLPYIDLQKAQAGTTQGSYEDSLNLSYEAGHEEFLNFYGSAREQKQLERIAKKNRLFIYGAMFSIFILYVGWTSNIAMIYLTSVERFPFSSTFMHLFAIKGGIPSSLVFIGPKAQGKTQLVTALSPRYKKKLRGKSDGLARTASDEGGDKLQRISQLRDVDDIGNVQMSIVDCMGERLKHHLQIPMFERADVIVFCLRAGIINIKHESIGDENYWKNLDSFRSLILDVGNRSDFGKVPSINVDKCAIELANPAQASEYLLAFDLATKGKKDSLGRIPTPELSAFCLAVNFQTAADAERPQYERVDPHHRDALIRYEQFVASELLDKYRTNLQHLAEALAERIGVNHGEPGSVHWIVSDFRDAGSGAKIDNVLQQAMRRISLRLYSRRK